MLKTYIANTVNPRVPKVVRSVRRRVGGVRFSVARVTNDAEAPPITSSEPGALLSRGVLIQLLFSRVRLRGDQTDGVLVESFEPAPALQIFQMTHDRPSPQNGFVGWGFGR